MALPWAYSLYNDADLYSEDYLPEYLLAQPDKSITPVSMGMQAAPAPVYAPASFYNPFLDFGTGFNAPAPAATPAAAPMPAAAPAGQMTLEQLLTRNIVGGQILEPLATQAGAQGWEYMPDAVNESGTAIGTGVADREQLMSSPLAGYTFDWKDTGPANTGTLTAYDPTGQQAGAYNQQDQSTSSALGEWAALAAAGFGGLGALGFGPLAGVLGGAGAAGGAAAEGAAGAGTITGGGGLTAGGSAGYGSIGGTLGGTGGTTLGVAGGGMSAGAGLNSALLQSLAAVAPASVLPSAMQSTGGLLAETPVAGATDFGVGADLAPSIGDFGGIDAFGQPSITQSLAGGIEPFVPQLPTIGAEATAFGGLPELSTLAAGAPVETAFGSFGAGLLAPEVATVSIPEAFNAAKDSQAYNAANNITTPVNTTPPATVNLGSLGGTMGTAGGVQGAFDVAKQAASDLVTTPNAVTGGGGLLGQTAPALQWLKDNPTLGRLLLGGVTSLLSGSGSSSAAAPVKTGPAKQWNTSLQQGLLTPVQQYAPAAIQQQRPAGLLAQGYANDGAWRYLKG